MKLFILSILLIATISTARASLSSDIIVTMKNLYAEPVPRLNQLDLNIEKIKCDILNPFEPTDKAICFMNSIINDQSVRKVILFYTVRISTLSAIALIIPEYIATIIGSIWIYTHREELF